jgi:hypothetical protein
MRIAPRYNQPNQTKPTRDRQQISGNYYEDEVPSPAFLSLESSAQSLLNIKVRNQKKSQEKFQTIKDLKCQLSI